MADMRADETGGGMDAARSVQVWGTGKVVHEADDGDQNEGDGVSEYHKIQTMFKRDEKSKRIIEGDWTLPEFEYLAGNQWDFTEKVDGTNIRIIWDGEAVAFGGRTDKAQIPAPLVAALIEMFPAEKLKAQFDGPVVLYGEGYGAKIQKGGGNYRADQSFVLFDVRVGGWWLQRLDVHDVGYRLEVEVVPSIARGTLANAIKMVRDGLRSQWGAFDAEGIVARPVIELVARSGHRIITKIKTRDFA